MTFLKELILTKQVNQKSAIFVTDGSSYIKVMMSIKHSDIAVLNIKSANYYCIICGISKKETISFIQNTALTKKAEDYKT